MALLYFDDIESNIYPYFQRFNNDRILSKVTAYVWIDIFNAHVSKGTGIRAIQDKLGISRDETIVFGDYLNDLPMAECALKSFAPSNAHPEVKRCFTDVIGSNEEGLLQKLSGNFFNSYRNSAPGSISVLMSRLKYEKSPRYFYHFSR